MNFLFLHNFKSSLRSLFKHKTQNIISIVCLAVGVVCFSTTTYLEKRLYNSFYSGTYRVYVSRMDESRDLMSVSMAKELQQLKGKSFDYFDISKPNFGRGFEVVDPDGKAIEVSASVRSHSPKFFVNRRFTSAIDGKTFGLLKEGDVVVTDVFVDKYLGGINPVGSTIRIPSYKNEETVFHSYIIRDVVNTHDHMLERELYDAMLFSYDFDPTYQEAYVWVNEGYTGDDVMNELKKRYPDNNLRIYFHPKDMSAMYFVFGLFLILGSSILVISLAGFLKMELQLFNMRNREIALRRCMGAHTYQLITPLVIETAIVFVAVLAASFGMSVLIDSVLFSVLEKITNQQFNFEIPYLFSEEVRITVCTLGVTLLIMICSVYRIIHTPLGMTVGKSGASKNRGRSIMLFVQYSACVLFITFILLIVGAMHFEYNGTGLSPQLLNTYKNTACIEHNINYEVSRSRKKVEGVKYVAFSSALEFKKDTVSNDGTERYDSIYLVRVVNYDYLRMIDRKITTSPTRKEIKDKDLIPVFATQKVCSQRNIHDLVNPVEDISFFHKITDAGNKLIGYAPKEDENTYFRSSMSYLVAEDYLDYYSLSEMSASSFAIDYYYVAKDGMYQRMCESIKEQYEASDISPMSKKTAEDLQFKSLYETRCSGEIMIDLVFRSSMVLAFFSILSVILSVYSAITLDTQKRRKEVAIRKVNGAKVRHIVVMFAKYYVKLIGLATIFVIPFPLFICLFICTLDASASDSFGLEEMCGVILFVISAALLIFLVTALTIWKKIYDTANMNPAEVMKAE